MHRRPRRAGRYALSVLYWRGRGTTFALALLIQVVLFQLLIVPLCVLIARSCGLADSWVLLANHISNVAGRRPTHSVPCSPMRCLRAAPVVALFAVFQRYFVASDLGSRVNG